jgi:hypothetical protein
VGITDLDALVDVPLPSLAVAVAVIVAIEVIWHVLVSPVPEAHPDQETVIGSPWGSVGLAVNVTVQVGWQAEELVTVTPGASNRWAIGSCW